MATIRSNPRGYNIHSPFAYHLVTEVLFNSGGITDDWKNPVTFQEIEFQGYLLIGRLLKFFKPAGIVLAGNRFSQLGTMMERMDFPDVPVISGSNRSVFSFNRELVIWSDGSALMDFVPAQDYNAVWFLSDLHTAKMRQFFVKLKNHHKVSQSYELNRFGFVIFNSELQKEDYYIRCREYR